MSERTQEQKDALVGKFVRISIGVIGFLLFGFLITAAIVFPLGIPAALVFYPFGSLMLSTIASPLFAGVVGGIIAAVAAPFAVLSGALAIGKYDAVKSLMGRILTGIKNLFVAAGTPSLDKSTWSRGKKVWNGLVILFKFLIVGILATALATAIGFPPKVAFIASAIAAVAAAGTVGAVGLIGGAAAIGLSIMLIAALAWLAKSIAHGLNHSNDKEPPPIADKEQHDDNGQKAHGDDQKVANQERNDNRQNHFDDDGNAYGDAYGDDGDGNAYGNAHGDDDGNAYGGPNPFANRHPLHDPPPDGRKLIYSDVYGGGSDQSEAPVRRGSQSSAPSL